MAYNRMNIFLEEDIPGTIIYLDSTIGGNYNNYRLNIPHIIKNVGRYSSKHTSITYPQSGLYKFYYYF
jgi:hypothetical protein